VEQLQYAAALVDPIRHLGAAIEHWEECYRIVKPTCLISTDDPEVLGDAYLHKAEMPTSVSRSGDSHLSAAGRWTLSRLQKDRDVLKAIQYFQKYLENKPDDLEVNGS